jgi:hypothetical protein
MFDSLGSRRPRRRVPGWLWLLLGGVLAGAADVIAVQERYLPPRLSAGEPGRAAPVLRAGRQRKATPEGINLQQHQQRLQAALAEKGKPGDELASSRSVVVRCAATSASVLQALPPDARRPGRGAGWPVQCARRCA